MYGCLIINAKVVLKKKTLPSVLIVVLLDALLLIGSLSSALSIRRILCYFLDVLFKMI